jgi:ABC-type polysaccharide/polyol phosphate export permease
MSERTLPQPTAPSAVRPPAPAPVGGALRDGLVITWRNLRRVTRIPELAIFAILQSIMFVLLFAFVFGGAIPVGEGGADAYRSYLMPGIFVQTLGFAAITSAIGMNEDMNKGLIDRFRSLPMARSAVVSGRVAADVVYNAGILAVLMLSGLLVGWRVTAGMGSFLAGVGLLLLFTFAMTWVGVWIGMSAPTPEVVQQIGFITLFPLSFVSNVFVPLESLPSFLRPIAEWNPFSALTQSARELFGNVVAAPSDSWPAQNPILLSLIWIVVIVAVFGPLGVRKYSTSSR